ncbi:hypothetical protein [Curtobacterium sp. MCSS17_016]|uniref:hypothetical protein n=1 Tax=Curtobacterium sp. MCSS17_016 TaxID=2175644 RepID=UPI000DA99E44|nr:hypothetical protein [Curtobacterium sp. MCSS17_016]WIE81292.1 hypothetical protein DEJ19_018840 [Curtobacterium sp. MCSS17_016]
MLRRRSDGGATDPVLVIAAVAVSLVLLIGGALTTSSVVASSKRNAAASSLVQVRVAEESARLRTGSYTADRSALQGVSSFPVEGAITGNGNCFGAFTSDGAGGYQYIDSGRSAAAAVPSPWPAAAPASYPADCFWPTRPAALTASRVTNLVPNPTAATAPDGSANLGLGLNAKVTSVSAATTAGTGFQVAPTGGSNDTALTFGDQAANTMRLSMQAGRTYTVSGTVILSAAQTSTNLQGARARGISVFATDALYYMQNSAQAPNKPGTYRLSLTFTLPVAATNAFIRFYNGSDSPGDTLTWSNLSLTESAASVEFGDGSSPGWAWSGEASKSISSGPALGG